MDVYVHGDPSAWYCLRATMSTLLFSSITFCYVPYFELFLSYIALTGQLLHAFAVLYSQDPGCATTCKFLFPIASWLEISLESSKACATQSSNGSGIYLSSTMARRAYCDKRHFAEQYHSMKLNHMCRCI